MACEPNSSSPSRPPNVVHACLKTRGKKFQRGTIHVVKSARTAGAGGPQGEKGFSAVVENSLEETIVQQSQTIELLSDEVETLTGGVVNLKGSVEEVETPPPTASPPPPTA